MDSDLAPQDPATSSSSTAGAPLNGTLEDNTPAGVLQVLSSQNETGAVRFSGDSGCTVYLHQGELYFAETPETAEDLAVALVRPGRLSPDEWDQSTAEGYATETVGEALIATGSIDREMLASVVLSVIYDPLIQLFRAPEGDFEFEPGIVHWIGPYRTFSIEAIVAEVRRRTREADEMAPIIPSLDSWVQTVRTMPSHKGSVSLRRDDWEVVVAAAQGRTVADLAIELGRGRWSTARIVYRLASVDLIEVVPAEGTTPAYLDEPAVDEAPTYDGFAPAATGQPTEPAAFDAGFETAFAPDVDAAPKSTTSGDSPPPLDASAFATEPTTETDDSWDTPSTWDNSSWADTPEPATGDATTDEVPAKEPSNDSFAAPTSDAWGEPDPLETSFSATDSAAAKDAPPTFEPPALHPDIAKALAESTYADSATAINAMAARLGAADDDDDDWDDAGMSAGDEASSFWSNDSDDKSFPWEEGSAAAPATASEFTWQPAAWDTGVETTPLPQREHVPADPDAPPAGPSGSADPQWLENLYSQFMPAGEDGAPGKSGPNSVEKALGADPGAAPKARTMRRLISAIRRL